ncbi:MAG: peptidoglycan DD-metalloendopeptidase family protein [Candidatus Eremiobacteraeota bacterium]|nr:peptidoglycan DD-metalloendopeptidase family protein [Candidatus Eremiobacteraeota bacterium]
MMANDRYFVKIVPARGNVIHRFNFRCRHIYAIVALIALFGAAALLAYVDQLRQANAQLEALQRQNAEQRVKFQTIDAQTSAISRELTAVRSQNEQLQQITGMRPRGSANKQSRGPVRKMAHIDERDFDGGRTASVEARVDGLAVASADTSDEAARLRRLTLRILNVRNLTQITRAHMLASIPSINPAGNAAVVGCYCYRTFPTAEFHAGVDLDANYGDVVRAAAAGTVVSAEYDGAYGLKVDIDHGNGYHTWYAHLSRADVHSGQAVAKAQPIALVGSSGRATGPHLHYQVMLNGQAIDPEPFLKGIPPQVLAALP